MFFRQILHSDLGCASYVLASGGEAAVVDPKWAIEEYLALAAEEGFELAHILETHNHADHLSGRGRLVEATGSEIHVPDGAEVDYEHEPLADGDALELGDVRIVGLATPGHRPEHTSYLVEDRGRADETWLVLTGDSLFIDDVARPDLAVEAEEGARALHASLRTLVKLDDFVEVWPAHIGGSLCGGAAISKKPESTIGFERRFNRFLRIEDEDEFVHMLTSELRPQPPNFQRIVELNRGPLVTAAPPVEPLAPARVQALLGEGALLLDGRTPREYDAVYVEGSINVTMVEAAVGTRAAWIAEPDTPIVVLGPGETEAHRLVELLAAVGFRELRGFVDGGIGAWHEADLPVETATAIDPATLADQIRANEAVLLDVREDDEWEEGHVPGSIHVPYHDLRDGLPNDVSAAADGKPIAVACSAGNRSSIAAGLLRRAGIENVEHVVDGGVPDLEQEGIELEKGRPMPPPVAPMLARLERRLPADGYLYEPKWDGFRGLAFRAGQELDLRSRNQRPLARYFPELVEALLAVPTETFVLDGEIVVVSEAGPDFPALLARLHPAAARVERLSRETPALFIAFDVISLEDDDLRGRPFRERRLLLERLLSDASPSVYLTPLTEDREEAERWLAAHHGPGVDGVVAKHEELRYEEGERRMVKVKRERTADCIVAGARWYIDQPLPSSLLLGLYDERGELRHVGIASSFTAAARRRLVEELEPYVVPLEGHPWEHGFLLGGNPTGRLVGAAGRWSPEEMEQDWTPLAPELVCEVQFDQLDEYRFRYPARFRRWRPDRDPRSCTLEQLETPPVNLAELLAQ